MATAYSQDLRDRVLAACDRGMPTKDVSSVFDVSPAWVRRLKQRRRETGETTPRPSGGATVIKIDMARLAGLIEAKPDATLKELVEMLGVKVAESSMCMAVRRLGYSYKKRPSTPRSRRAPTSRHGVTSSAPPSPRSTRDD